MSGHLEKRKVSHEIGETVQKDEDKGIKIGLATSRFPAGLQRETGFLTQPLNSFSSSVSTYCLTRALDYLC